MEAGHLEELRIERLSPSFAFRLQVGACCSEAVPLDQLSAPKAPPLTWGLDSPLEALEIDVVPEVPGWPLFSENGRYATFDARVCAGNDDMRGGRGGALSEPWTRLRCQMRCPQRTTATAADVSLPTPPKSGYGSLWKLRRELLRSAPSGATGETPSST